MFTYISQKQKIKDDHNGTLSTLTAFFSSPSSLNGPGYLFDPFATPLGLALSYKK